MVSKNRCIQHIFIFWTYRQDAPRSEGTISHSLYLLTEWMVSKPPEKTLKMQNFPGTVQYSLYLWLVLGDQYSFRSGRLSNEKPWKFLFPNDFIKLCFWRKKPQNTYTTLFCKVHICVMRQSQPIIRFAIRKYHTWYVRLGIGSKCNRCKHGKERLCASCSLLQAYTPLSSPFITLHATRSACLSNAREV